MPEVSNNKTPVNITLDIRKWQWVIADELVVILSKEKKSDKIHTIKGKGAGNMFKSLAEGRNYTTSDDLIEQLKTIGIVHEKNNGDTNKPAITTEETAGIMFKTCTLKDLLPKEIRIMTATELRTAESQSSGTCGDGCLVGVAGCVHDAKVHFFAMDKLELI